MKTHWTEAELRSFPSGEHDFFDRKSGLMLGDPEFRRDLAKAMSAFANSGGGQILLGIRNDGLFDGVEPMKGRTPTREWLEQIIPQLTSYPLRDFRVHEVQAATPSDIPPGRTVIVVDVGDSVAAPHQSAEDAIYYYRSGSHSVRAPHFYLEALRNRLVKPVLTAKILGLEPISAFHHSGGLFVILFVKFQIHNAGRVAAYRWFVDISACSRSPEQSSAFYVTEFPKGGINVGELPVAAKTPILPGLSVSDHRFCGLNLSTATTSKHDFGRAVESALSDQLDVNFCVVSENSRGEMQSLDLALLRNKITPEKLEWLLPDWDNKRYLGSGYYCPILSIEPVTRIPDHVTIQGVIKNDDNNACGHPWFAAYFWNEKNQIVCSKDFEIKRFPRGHEKPFDTWVDASDITQYAKASIVFLIDKAIWQTFVAGRT